MKIQPINPAHLFSYDEDLLSLPAGSILFKQGDQGAHMYVLKSGRADIVTNGRVTEKAMAGTILGEMTILANTPRSATVIATTDCKFVAIGRQRFESLVSGTPGFLPYLRKIVAGRLSFIDTASTIAMR
jgi:CRP-like cAMP-binding protein